MELFVFTDNLVFESLFWRGRQEYLFCLNYLSGYIRVQMRGYLIQHVVHIVGTRIIEAGIDGISRRNNLVGIMRGLNPLQFVPLDQRSEERSNGV